MSQTPREFAHEITLKLQQAGYQALWAGGCVRDQLLGRIPKDYDVATSARPEQVRDLFGHKRTLAIGASFGVITVLGPKSAGPIEVATFRRDAEYSDGRRPDSVEYTDAREDAMRRDFTINGMFYDPVADKVEDYVDGVKDLDKKIIRAIGDPQKRFDEDKLRLLRAIRFAATYGFVIEPTTLAAIQQHAHEIKVVSGERIGAEMRRMLASPNREVAARLLRESTLLVHILEGGEILFASEADWQNTLRSLELLEVDDFPCAASILLFQYLDRNSVDLLAQQWKLSNEEKKSIAWISRNVATLAKADGMLWSEIQPLLIHPDAERTVQVGMAISRAETPERERAGFEFCQVRLNWPRKELDPPILLDGYELRKLDLNAGPLFGKILKTLRSEQLDGKIQNREQAIARAREMVNKE
jgi:poly(A) polymerase